MSPIENVWKLLPFGRVFFFIVLYFGLGVDDTLKDEILDNFKDLLALKRQGTNLFFTDIDKIKKIMLEELKISNKWQSLSNNDGDFFSKKTNNQKSAISLI